MYRDRHFKVVIGAMAVLGLIILASLVYAGFTGQLNITGNATARQSNWDVHFENLSNVTTIGSAKVLSQPSLESPTSIEDYDVTVTSPGDTISFTVKVVNEGNYNASISSVSVGTPECSGTDSTSNNNVCNRLSYTLTYENGATVQVGDELLAKDYAVMKVTLSYAEFSDPSLLATEDVSISNLGITINYQQSGSALVKDNGKVANYRVYHQGEKITLNNEDYWVIANSGAGQDYVAALKDLPLTVAEVNLYGGAGTENNHVNRYAGTYTGTARGSVYGEVAYYTSETCGVYNGSNITTGCNIDYDGSDVKYIVDAWALSINQDNNLKLVNNYRARLLYATEFFIIPDSDYMGNQWWLMDKASDSIVARIASESGVGAVNVTWGRCVRPVINVYKSSLEPNNNNNE